MMEVTAWQGWPLEPVYPVVFFDVLRVRIRQCATRPYTSLWVSCPMALVTSWAADRDNRRGQFLADGVQRSEDLRSGIHPDCGHGRDKGRAACLPGHDSAELCVHLICDGLDCDAGRGHQADQHRAQRRSSAYQVDGIHAQ